MDSYSLYLLTKDLHVLFVEDDFSFRNSASNIFSRMFRTLDVASDGKEGLEKYLTYKKEHDTYYDLVITDIIMPNMDGVEMIKNIISKNSDQPIIVLSASNESEYLIDLINIGVDRFMLKPLQSEKMISILYDVCSSINPDKRVEKKDSNLYDLGEDYVWDIEKRELLYNSEHIKLTKKEILLLECLVKNNNKLCTNELIFDVLWGLEEEKASISTLKSIISRLRKKVPQSIIENVYGMGYRLVVS